MRNGLGQHIAIIPPDNAVIALKLTYIGIFVIVIGCSLSKTSFAITLLRIVSSKWQIAVLWFIIVSMNIVMILCAGFYIGQCENPATLWNNKVVSKCWDPSVATNFALFAGGMHFSNSHLLEFSTNCKTDSVLCVYGYRTRPPSLDSHFDSSNENKGKIGCCVRDEPRPLVGSTEIWSYIIGN